MSIQQLIQKSRRIVLKFGSQVVIKSQGIVAEQRLKAILDQCFDTNPEAEFIIVTSGAVGLGRHLLGRKESLRTAERQACAAVGQAQLVQTYQELLRGREKKVAQILITAGDFSDRVRYVNLSKTLETLLEMGVTPVLNENDSVSTRELEIRGSSNRSFGDNDHLSALVAGKLGADLLIIFTDVDGIYDDNPKLNKKAKLIGEIEDLESLNQIRNRGKSAAGTGGMASKLEAARTASLCGVITLVTSGHSESPLQQGTIIRPRTRIPAKKRWIALSSGFEGILVVNEGAESALREKNASLLPVGVVQTDGDFKKNTIVSIQNQRGEEIGRGLVEQSSDEIRKQMGSKGGEQVIHRDNLVVFEGTLK